MDAFDFLSAYVRMTKPDEHGECQISCSECPLTWANNGSIPSLTCSMFIRRYPDRAAELVRKWEEENKHEGTPTCKQTADRVPGMQESSE